MTRAIVREVNGQLVLDDPDALAMVGAVERWNLYRIDEAAVRRLEARASQKGPFAVVVIDVDDPVWRPLVDHLMPGHDWDQFRQLGQQPIARGVVPRDFLVDLAASVLEAQVPAGVFTAVFARGGVSVFEVLR